MTMPVNPSDVLHLIQASVAPVVLISGVGLLLLTLTARLGRIVDRTRLVAGDLLAAPAGEGAGIRTQLEILRRRARLIRMAVGLSASAVGNIGILITVLFVGLLFGWDVGYACAALFISSMGCLVAAMLVFVTELFSSLTALELTMKPPPR